MPNEEMDGKPQITYSLKSIIIGQFRYSGKRMNRQRLSITAPE